MAGYADLKPGRLLGKRYRLFEVLGQGAFGVVWRATHEVLGDGQREGLEFRKVALKLFHDNYVDRLNAHEVFKEAVILERLASRARAAGAAPHIVATYDIGVFEDCFHTAYVAMELAGDSLEVVLRKSPEIPLPRAVKWLRQICAGVRLAHENGILHRDLKPDNVLFTNPEFLKVADFGVAIERHLAFREGGQAGTISYSPPDQGTSTLPTPADDVYSLGVILLRCLIGSNPLEAVLLKAGRDANHRIALRQAQRQLADLIDPATGQSISDGFLQLRRDPSILEILGKCLAFSPDRRFPNAAALDEALQEWEGPCPKKPGEPPPPVALKDLLDRARSLRRRRMLDEALALIEEAERRWPDSREVAFERSRALEASGRLKEAIDCLDRCLRRSTERPEASLRRLAQMLEQAGDVRRARTIRQEIESKLRQTR